MAFRDTSPHWVGPGNDRHSSGRSMFLRVLASYARASSARKLHPPGVDGFSNDELLADAIGYVALNVLDRLADDAEGRRAFVEGFLRLATPLAPPLLLPRCRAGSGPALGTSAPELPPRCPLGRFET
jgi:hypothetical protein